MAETDVASTITPSLSTAVTFAIGPVSETSVAAQVFNPLRGYWTSDPLVLPGTPVTSSVVRWAATIPAAGSTVTVETSINNGASWDTAINGGAIPRLSPGNTVTQQILTRITLTRVLSSDTSPSVSFLDVRVSCDSSIDELVPIVHGMINKVEASVTGGTTGSGSGSGSGGSPGVTSTGGGQTGGGLSLKISGVDPSRAISRNKWQQPFSIPSGLSYATAIRLMVQNRLPSQTDEQFSLSSTSSLTPLLVFGVGQGGDPWQDIQDLAAAIGYEVFFDPAGVCVFRPIPDPTIGAPVWTFDEDLSPTIVSAARELSDEDTVNYVVVKGASTSSTNPVTAFAFDNNPSSATYVNGPFGTVSAVVTMSQIITQEDVQTAADAFLLSSLGAAEKVVLTCVPMPALEPGDIVRVNVSDVLASGTYLINDITTPLSPAEGQTLTCFRQSTQLS